MRNLLGRLRHRPPASLVTIAGYWDIELQGRDVYQDIAHLFRVLNNPWSFAIFWESLNDQSRAIVRAFMQKPEPFTPAQLNDMLSEPEGDPKEDLRLLFRQGLLYADESEATVDQGPDVRLLIPRELVGLVNRLDREREMPDPSQETPERLLDRVEDSELADMASQEGYELIPALANRDDMASFLLPRLGDPGRIARVVRGLDTPAAGVWEYLCNPERNGSAAAVEIEQELGLARREMRRAIRDLVVRALIWRGYDEQDRTCLVIPIVIRQPNPPSSMAPPELEVIDDPTLEPESVVFPWAIAWDMTTALRATQSARTRVGANVLRETAGHTNASALRQLAPSLWFRQGDMPPSGYVSYLGFLADQLGLIFGQDPVRVSESSREWSRLSFSDQVQRFMTAWLNSPEWPEGHARQDVQVWGADWPRFRAALMDHLRQFSSGSWYTLSSVSKQFGHYAAESLGSDFSAAAGRDRERRQTDGGRKDIAALAAEATLQSACVWLGIIETTRIRGQGTVCRLSPVGAWLLGLIADPPFTDSEVPAPIQLNDDLSIDLIAPTAQIVWLISAFADVSELDQPPVYRISERSLQRGLDYGAKLEQITGLLERFSGEDLSSVVSDALHIWAERYHRAELSWAMIIELDHAENLDELEPALAEAALVMERVGGNRILIRVPNIEQRDVEAARVEHILREFGHTPRWPGPA